MLLMHLTPEVSLLNVLLEDATKLYTTNLFCSHLIFFFPVFPAPDKVTDLVVVDVATSSVSLNWNKPQGNADSYKIQWNSTNHGSNNGSTSDTNYTINSLVPGVLYNIEVTAVVALGSVEGKPVFHSTFTSRFIISEYYYSFLKREK